MGSFITMIQVLGYSVALSGLMLFKMTGGSAVSPAGQQVMRVVHGVTVSLLLGRSLPSVFQVTGVNGGAGGSIACHCRSGGMV